MRTDVATSESKSMYSNSMAKQKHNELITKNFEIVELMTQIIFRLLLVEFFIMKL